MKQICAPVIILFFTAFSSFAQSFEGGVAAGLVGSQVAGDTYSGYNKAGIYAGFWVRLPVGSNVSVQTEVSYFQKGSRHNPDEKHQDMTFYLMRLGYIEMPFLLQYQFNRKLRLEAGPSLSILLHSYEALDYMETSYGKFTLLNPSFMAGISYPLTERIRVHFRVDNSLLSIRTDQVTGNVHRFFDHGQYNDCILLFVSYKL